MDDLFNRVLEQAPTIAVLLWIFIQMRNDVKEILANILRLMEKYADAAVADCGDTNGKDTPN